MCFGSEVGITQPPSLARAQEVIDAFRTVNREQVKTQVGSEQVVLVEGESKRSTREQPQLSGRADSNKVSPHCLSARHS